MTGKRRAPKPKRYAHQDCVNEFALVKRNRKDDDEYEELTDSSVLNAADIVTSASLVSSGLTVTPAGPSNSYPVEQTYILNSSTSMTQGTVSVSSLSQSGGVMSLSQLPDNSIHIALPGEVVSGGQFLDADGLEGASVLEVPYKYLPSCFKIWGYNFLKHLGHVETLNKNVYVRY